MTQRVHQLEGQIFWRLTVVSDAGTRGTNRLRYWNCLCVCGKTKAVAQSSLVHGVSKSCGCLAAEMSAERRKTHGKSRTAMYNIWCSMRQRCNDVNCPAYANYGARGIKLDPAWENFERFLSDMGQRPPGSSIDRIDNDKGYGPDNCRWATDAEQANNKRTNRRITYAGRDMTVSQLSALTGLDYFMLHQRINKLGWAVERAATTPSRQKPKHQLA